MVTFKLIIGLMFIWSTAVVLLGLFVAIFKRKESIPLDNDQILRFACIICAHNEEVVIHRPIESLLNSDYPEEKLDIVVFADNCSDRTAEIANAFGSRVKVYEKSSPSSGKGDVLHWGVELIKNNGYDALAIVDADNEVDKFWLKRLNAAMARGAKIVTGHRMASNAFKNLITGWYSVYWNLMNELSNRVRANLMLSSMLTGTGFAFRLSVLPEEGWNTKTFVEDLEFAFQQNVRGNRVVYVDDAVFFDEQPISFKPMWRQLCRWATGGLQIIRHYLFVWLMALIKMPTPRMFDCFAIITLGLSGTILLLLDIAEGDMGFLVGYFAFCWASALLATFLSRYSIRSLFLPILSFPIFVLILSATVAYSVVHPQHRWKPIQHGN